MALECTYKALKRGKRVVSKWQRLIQKADCSKLGWSEVAKHTANKLAYDSDNKKYQSEAGRAAKCSKKCVETFLIKLRADRTFKQMHVVLIGNFVF